MVGKYKVITLCGSTRFKDAFLETQKRPTLEGNIVISVGLFGHAGDAEVWTEGTKEMLDDIPRLILRLFASPFKKKKYKGTSSTVSSTVRNITYKTICTCQNCGHRWEK